MRIKCYYLLLVSFLFFSFVGGCSETGSKSETSNEVREPSPGRPAVPLSGRITSPSAGDEFTRGENIEISLNIDDNAAAVSSVSMTIDGREAEFAGQVPGTLTWDSSGEPVGRRQIRIRAVFDDGTAETYPLNVILKSDIAPQQYTYRVINSYPHDIRAFTQGLIFHDGYLYESTGRHGESTLRKVDLETGEVLRSLNLDKEFWGEGLCLHDGNLYQLTWKSNVGFIYDKETFRVLRRIHYPTEGWGLTSDGINIYKTDGSHYVYLMDPRYFSETGRIEVFDHNGKVEQLNELEFIDGHIYANVFLTDNIVIIDPVTGQVTGVVDLTGILDQRYHHPDLDVLNGIAWDSEGERLFVTGKNWPRLFEIELVAR